MDECVYFFKDKDSLDGDWEFRENLDLLELFGGYRFLSFPLLVLAP